MTYQEIKKKKEEDMNKLFESLGVFWAFSNEQFKQGLDGLVDKKILLNGEKVANIGAGGFIPSKNIEALRKGMKDIEENFKKSVKDSKLREEQILHELLNFECFYTGDITPCLNSLGEDYTKEEVNAIYQANRNKYND